MADFKFGASDSLSKAGAEALAQRIERHWRVKGYTEVKTWVEPIEEAVGQSLYGVRSNLFAGLPPS